MMVKFRLCSLFKKRLIFGLSSAPEMYQYVIQQTLQGIPRARNIPDDITVFGSDQESHDKNLDCTLSHLESTGLTVNRVYFQYPRIFLLWVQEMQDRQKLQPKCGVSLGL